MIFTLSHLATQEVKLLAESFVEGEIYKLIPIQQILIQNFASIIAL